MIDLLIIFGGKSSEHEISCISAGNVIENVNKAKYNDTIVGIDKDGNWHQYVGNVDNVKKNTWLSDERNLIKIGNIIDYIKQFDVVFPALHGKYGEDGTIQGLFEMFGIKYVGCNNITSAIGMDKSITKMIAERVKVPVVPYKIIKKGDKVKFSFDYPIIVKPCSEGSSYGVTKVNSEDELEKAIENAFIYDDKLLIEKFIKAREIECAVLGNKDYIVSDLGEIIPEHEFYDFESKYKSKVSVCKIPADIEQIYKEKIIKYAKVIAETIGVRGLCRVDFFISKDDGKIYFNEVNTMPGFTDISMYPKLIEHYGIKYSELIDKLIELALE